MARPKKSPDEKRSVRKTQRYTLSEDQEIAEKAAAVGLSDSEFIRRRSLSYHMPKPRASQLDASAMAALNRIAAQIAGACNNTNQLTASVHRGSDFQNYWRAVGADLQQDRADLRRIINALLAELDI